MTLGAIEPKAAVMTQKLEDGKMAAQRMVRKGQHMIEDCMAETAHEVKRHPMEALAIAFAAGALVGLLIPRIRKV